MRLESDTAESMALDDFGISSLHKTLFRIDYVWLTVFAKSIDYIDFLLVKTMSYHLPGSMETTKNSQVMIRTGDIKSLAPIAAKLCAQKTIGTDNKLSSFLKVWIWQALAPASAVNGGRLDGMQAAGSSKLVSRAGGR